MESQRRVTEWLEILRIANRDDSEFGRVMRDKDLRVSTKLDRDLTDNDGKLIREYQGRSIRAVVLIAHAGDGKSHFFKELSAHADEHDEPVIPFDSESHVDLSRPGLHMLNDPSLTGSQAVARFLAAAFAQDSEDDGVRFVAGVNRGKLRDLLPLVRDEDPAAANWLSHALGFEEHTHWPDKNGRLAVPLDRRLLVPGPRQDRQSLEQSPVRKLACQLFAALHDDLVHEVGAPDWTPGEWADRVSVILALLEAGGHHVTFREALSLSAVVGEGLVEGDESALEALFQGKQTFHGVDAVPALQSILNLLRRLDPARVAVPSLDAGFTDLSDRDAAVRRLAVDRLVTLFTGTVEESAGEVVPLPYRHGVEFLRLLLNQMKPFSRSRSSHRSALRVVNRRRATRRTSFSGYRWARCSFISATSLCDCSGVGERPLLLSGCGKLDRSSTMCVDRPTRLNAHFRKTFAARIQELSVADE